MERPDDSTSSVLPPDLARLYPFARHYFKLPEGDRMHYIDVGQGPVVLMLHGNPTWSWMYRNLALVLSHRFRCIVPDHVGCGLSDKPQDYPYTLNRHIRNVKLLLASLGIWEYNLVAHDWGGAIGMGFAGRRPERVGRIVLMNTAAFHSEDIPLRIAACKIPVFGTLAIRGFNAFAAAAVHMACERPMSSAVARGYLWPYGNWHDRIATLRFVQDIPLHAGHPSDSELTRVESRLSALADKPMLLCWGMKDWCFTPAFLEQWRTRFPKAQVESYAEAGHYLLEDAGEQVVLRIADFMSADSATLHS